MADMIPDEWTSDQRNGRRNSMSPNRLRFPNGNPRTVWNNRNAANLMVNNLIFGENESINELIQ